ncbi:MAG: DUF1592 domain-containing protein [Deltaproteobacteria bacterium]|nr:DUF1592 domain-containing protein [Deltaproteobacteria bacterium]
MKSLAPRSVCLSLPRSTLAFVFVASTFTACTATMNPSGGDDDGAGGSAGGGDAGGKGADAAQGGNAGGAMAAPALGVVPLRRLTKREYENTIRDLLGAPASYAAGYPVDDVSKHGFATATNTSELMATSTMEAADGLARFAVGKLNTLLPCSTAGDDACATSLIENLGQRAFRRPLLTSEKQELFALYNYGRKELALDFKGGVRVLLTAMLQAPQFLYHWEQGEQSVAKQDDGSVSLGAYHLASRLSYFLWGSMPDAALFEAAANNRLSDPGERETQARRLLADAKGRGTVSDFFTQLLYLDGVVRAEKDTQSHPEWTAAVRAAALLESQKFVQDVVLDGDGTWRSLMTANGSFVDEPLGKLYGVTNVKGTSLAKADLPFSQRAGLLTRAAFLAAHSGPTDTALVTPIHRGQTVRKRLLCQTIPPPMANIQSRASSGTTTRERLNSHVADPACAACHTLMDDLGFAFENYDATGRWRTMDNGKPVDASGIISALDSGEPTFNNGLELAKLLANTPEVNECVASSLLRYGLGRMDTEGEAKSLLGTLQGDELNVREALIKVAASRGFAFRLLSQGEVLP